MKTENIPYKIYLSESEMPQNWYNVRADIVPILGQKQASSARESRHGQAHGL